MSSLIILLLAKNNLQGSIPEHFARIPRLETLDLAYNNLSGRVPRNFFNSTSLTYLGLGVNELIVTIPSVIGYTLPNIQTLIMERNHFGGPLPMSLVHASNLQVLELGGNAFTGVVPSYWALPSLTQLDLSANNLETVDWISLSSTTSSNISSNLQQLSLGENNFSGSIPSEIGNLGNLTVL
jgi:Leucine-rich repeat (LRR) protein